MLHDARQDFKMAQDHYTNNVNYSSLSVAHVWHSRRVDWLGSRLYGACHLRVSSLL